MNPLIERDLCIDISGVPGAIPSYLEMDMAYRSGLPIRVEPAVQENRSACVPCVIFAADNQSQSCSPRISGRIDPSRKGNLILNLQRRRNRISYENILVGAVETERLPHLACGKCCAILQRAIVAVLNINRIAISRPPTDYAWRRRDARWSSSRSWCWSLGRSWCWSWGFGRSWRWSRCGRGCWCRSWRWSRRRRGCRRRGRTWYGSGSRRRRLRTVEHQIERLRAHLLNRLQDGLTG